MGTPTAQPTLAKKRSIMDRLRPFSSSRGSEPKQAQPRQNQIQEQEPQRPPPAAWVPRHAATDFSRIGARPRNLPSEESPVPPEQRKFTVSRTQPLKTIVDDLGETGSVGDPGLVRTPNKGREENASPGNSGASSVPTYSHVQNAAQPSDPSVPPHVGRGDTKSSKMGITSATPETGESSQSKEQHDDFQIFLALAEAKEREFRERQAQMISDFANRSTTVQGYKVPYYDPLAESKQKQQSPAQIPLPNAENLGNGVMAMSKEPEGGIRLSSDQRRSGSGSKTASLAVQDSPSDEARASQSKRTTWNRKPTAVRPDAPAAQNQTVSNMEQKGKRSPTTTPVNGVSAFLPGSKRLWSASREGGRDGGQQHRGLRKQSSFRQIIGEYIRPPRQPIRYGTADATPDIEESDGETPSK
ncbi:hypothetical protein VTK73DRAFT_2777 [Phialemonium thermophilum]|uniref:Uncharacterized protein n=1 Tax=Phialemonium thermophilum TaxID=223376 RepID=A0ABR3X2T8_9PEZI